MTRVEFGDSIVYRVAKDGDTPTTIKHPEVYDYQQGPLTKRLNRVQMDVLGGGRGVTLTYNPPRLVHIAIGSAQVAGGVAWASWHLVRGLQTSRDLPKPSGGLESVAYYKSGGATYNPLRAMGTMSGLTVVGKAGKRFAKVRIPEGYLNPRGVLVVQGPIRVTDIEEAEAPS